MMLQHLKLARQRFHSGVRDDADFAVFERHRIAVVPVGGNPVDAQQFAGHLEPRDLIAPVVGDDASLEKAGANRVERSEIVACAKQILAALDGFAYRHQLV